MSKEQLLFCPLGGSGEIGMNLNLYAYGKKDNENNEVDIKIKFKEIVINNNNNYGSFNLNNIKNPKNIIFKIHNNSINNNNGAVCNTKTKTDILTIINNIDKSIIKDKMNKESLCQYLAYLYYINNNLKIVPYKKMIN